MTLLTTSRLTLTSLVAIGCGVATMPLGCDGKETKSNSPTTATAGSTSSPATGGGVAVGSGGDTASAGSGGTTSVPNVTCTSDLECKSSGLLCNKTTSKCVQCLQEADCAAASQGKLCDVGSGKCVSCLTAADCPNPATSECVAQACVAAKTCVNSLDCTTASAPLCNRTTSRCVECVDAADCAVGGQTDQVCVTNRCQTSCATTEDCAEGSVCNTTATPPYCATCLTNADCPTGNSCTQGACVSGSGACAGNSAKPCTAIPAFTGTQVVDGYGDDFCNVPGFTLAFDSTAAKINPASGESATATYPERATFKVAWSADSVHVHIEVTDPSVSPNTNPGEIWNGDGVEFMISTSNELTGLTSADVNTLHVIANSSIGVTVKAWGGGGNHAQISDPNLFKTQTTSQGYAVELKMPWPEGVQVTAGTAIYFDAAVNSGRPNADNAPQRVAQALLFQAPTPTNTTCTGTGNDIAPFCDDRLWCPTKFQ